MLPVGVLGLNFKTAQLPVREAIAKAAATLIGERALFFRYPVVVLSTCNRTEIYFSSDDLALAHVDILAHLRLHMQEPFEQHLYSYFGNDCFSHLCCVAAGVDSAILAETEIQGQVRQAYAEAHLLSSGLHYIFQKGLKVSKWARSQATIRSLSLYGVLWQRARWLSARVLLVGNSETNRGLISFLRHKGVKDLSLCTRNPSAASHLGIAVFDREELKRLDRYDVIVCATCSEEYLITKTRREQIVFDLSVPRNVDPDTAAQLYNIDQLSSQEQATGLASCEALIREEALKLSRIYALKTQHVLESVGTE